MGRYWSEAHGGLSNVRVNPRLACRTTKIPIINQLFMEGTSTSKHERLSELLYIYQLEVQH